MITLQDVTGYESGAVIYDEEVIVLNWSAIDGLPRLFGPLAPIGLGEDLESLAIKIGKEGMMASEIETALQAAADEEGEQGGDQDIKIAGAWRVGEALVVTFEGWI